MDDEKTEPRTVAEVLEESQYLVKVLGKLTLQLLDDLALLAAHSGDEVYQGIIEELSDDLKPLAKYAARYGVWRG